jgi:hypothetical protein
MDLFLDVLKTLLPDNAVLPKRLTYMTTGQTDDNELNNNDSYSNKQKSYFTFDCCPCAEAVYVGDKLNNKFCSIFKMKRYTDETIYPQFLQQMMVAAVGVQCQADPYRVADGIPDNNIFHAHAYRCTLSFLASHMHKNMFHDESCIIYMKTTCAKNTRSQFHPER